MGKAQGNTVGKVGHRVAVKVIRRSRWLAVLVLITTLSAACGSDEPAAAPATSSTSVGAEPTTVATAKPQPGFAVRGSSQHQDPDGYMYLISVDVNIKGAALNTTNSKPGFARVFYDTSASIGYKNVTGGGRTASLNSQQQHLRLMWELANLTGPVAEHCAKAPFVIKGKSYCILGDINFRPNTNSDADFRRKIADGETSSYTYPSKFREPERAASNDIPEEAAKALVDMFNRGQVPDHLGMVSDQRRLEPVCLIGKDLDAAAIQNVWWMFLVDKTGKVNNTIC